MACDYDGPYPSFAWPFFPYEYINELVLVAHVYNCFLARLARVQRGFTQILFVVLLVA